MTESILAGLFGILLGIFLTYLFLQYRKKVFATNPVSILLLCAPPEDLNRDLFEIGLPAIDGQAAIEVVYCHKYAGPHEIGIVCDQPIDTPIRSPIQIGMHCLWRSPDGKVVAEKDGTITLDKPWFAGIERNGFSLVRYDVPSTVPVRKRIVLAINVRNCDQAFANYGPVRIYARNICTP